MGQGEGLASGNGQDGSSHLLLSAGSSAQRGAAHGTAANSHILEIVLIWGSSITCWILPASWGSGGCLRAGKGAVPTLRSRPHHESEIGAASPCAAAATLLLNYINRLPSSVIFYYTGKKTNGLGG